MTLRGSSAFGPIGVTAEAHSSLGAAMAPQTGTALIVLVAFVLPGFVTLAFVERTYAVPVRDRSPLELVLLALYYSAISYGIAGLVAWPLDLTLDDVRGSLQDGSVGVIAAAGIVVVFLLPALIATVSRVWTTSRLRERLLSGAGVSAVHRIETGWDFYFRQRRPALVIATLRDGAKVGGFFGDMSFATYSVDGRDLFLEQRWSLDEGGWFDGPVEGDDGVWVAGADVVWLALYDPFYDPQTTSAPTAPEPAPADDSNGETSAPR